MLVPLEEVKQYLRIDNNEEDTLLESFSQTAQQLCVALLRVKDLAEVEERATVRIALLYAVSYL